MILNIPESWIFQGYTEFRRSLNNSWICLLTNIMRKTAIWTIFYFFSPPPLTVLRKFVQSWGQALLWVCLIVYGGEEGVLKDFKTPIIFCHLLSEISLKKERGGTMHAVSNNSYLPWWTWLCVTLDSRCTHVSRCTCTAPKRRKWRYNSGSYNRIDR